MTSQVSRARKLIEDTGIITRFCFEIISGFIPGRFDISDTIKQMSRIGVGSLAMVSITGLFTGLTLVVQVGGEFKKMGAASYIGGIVALTLARELGPVLTALVVTGRNGSAMAAELGTMAVTEQIDALRALAVNPLRYLGTPRILACAFMLPILTLYSTVIGVLGGGFAASLGLDISSVSYYESILQNTTLADLYSGLLKALAFGLIIGFTGCWKGFKVRGGADEVGKATTGAVVAATFFILVSNYFLALLTRYIF